MINLTSDQRVELIGLDEGELREFMAGLGEKPFRARQLYDAIYRRRIADFESMTDLPKTLRRILEEHAVLTRTRIHDLFLSSDGTRRYLLKLGDGREVEAVFMPDPRRDTICISSQVGCPLACDFCMTGVLGLKRNMTAGEIVSQIVLVLNQVYGSGGDTSPGARRVMLEEDLWDDRHFRKFHTNIVMMGMGEPLLNYDNAMKSIRLFAADEGLAITPRRITLSTAGIVPRIYDLAREEIRPRLAISLTAATDELRNRLFPINRKYPLAELIEACRKFPLRDRERFTFEYVMLAGVNDSDRDARDLVRLLSSTKSMVNIIPHNPAPELPYLSSPMDRILQFQSILTQSGLPSFIRRPRGQDISAACGQLAARHKASA